MGIYKNFIILGGGGGNEIANQICVFDSSNQDDVSVNILRKKVHEENTGKDVANYIDISIVSAFNFLILIFN